MMYLSEAMARLGGTKFERVGFSVSIYGNNFEDHAPEGIELLATFPAYFMEVGGITKFMIAKRVVSARCVELGLMTRTENEQPQVFPADEA